MLAKLRPALLAVMIGLVGWSFWPTRASAQDYNMGRFFYYPYYYFPHSYWPTQSPQWPEKPGAPYMRPPAYMAYPAFHEPHWRYEMNKPHSYHRGFHFWLDSF